MLTQEKFKQHVQFLLNSSFDPEHIRAFLEYAEDYTNLLVQTNAELLGANVELTLTNTQLTTDYANALAGQNTQLANQVNTAHATFRAVRNLDELKISELQEKLELALHQEEQTAQQNNILLSQMQAMQDKQSPSTFLGWNSTQWVSFNVGLFGSAALMEATGHVYGHSIKPYSYCFKKGKQGLKKVFGKTKMRVPDTMKPTISPMEQCDTHIGVPVSPVPTVPVVQVHN